MNTRAEIATLGGLAGGVATALAMASSSYVPQPAGLIVGGVLAMAGGAGACLFVSGRLVGRVAVRVEDLLDPSGHELRRTGWHDLDERLDDLADAMAEASRAGADVEGLAAWARQLNPGDAASPRCDPRQVIEQSLRSIVELMRELVYRAERMTSGADDQTASVARTASSVEALSDRIDRISQNAEEAADAGRRTREEARRGLELIQGIIAGMDRLGAHVEGNARKARRLGDRSEEIGTIVELIAGLSSRTDMLALNATIESVRAGEHGRGFAVVAEEIRKLAEKAANATREVGTLVEAIRADVHESVRALGAEQVEMEQEGRRVREAGSALERISQFAELSARLVEGISHSANDQVLATQELVRAIQRISDVSGVIRDESVELRAGTRELLGRPVLRWASEGAAPVTGVLPGSRSARRPRRLERAEAR
jgi:twitching motility protein PilJ